MVLRKSLCPFFLTLIAAAIWFAGGAKAGTTDHSPVMKPAKVGGKWRIAWDVRLGTVRGILDLKQSGSQVTGTFLEYGKTYPLTGSVQGQAFTFEVPFSGPRPYTIEFIGKVERDKIAGRSQLKGGGRVFLGHAGEVDEPERPWTATKGLKHPNNAPGKPPDDDDDDDRRH